MTSLAGTSIEWYDFFLYGTAAALIFPRAFFPADMPETISLIAAFGTFAVGFVARPVGGVIFGHFGDLVGRKKALVTALMMMGVATTLIGFLPTYETIGIAAPLLLTVLRFTQGLAIGGQWGGAMLLVTENAPSNQRGFYGAFAQAGAPCGLLLANFAFLIVSTTLSDEAFLDWGWRIPFILSVVLIALSAYVQIHLEDTAAFKDLEEHAHHDDPDLVVERSPILEAIRLHPREIVLGAGAFLAVQVSFYIFVAWIVAYGSNPAGLGLSRDIFLTAVLISTVIQLPVLFLASSYSDRKGRRGVYMAGAILLGIWAFVVFPLIDTGDFLLITVAITGGQCFIALMYGPQAAFLAELFSTRVRYSGASLGYQIGAILGGALAPTIATFLWSEFGTFYVAVYIAVACVLTLISVILLTETSGRELT